jgi:hypothetical protein
MAIMSPYGNLLNLRNTMQPVGYGGMQSSAQHLPTANPVGPQFGGMGMSPGQGQMPGYAVGPQPYGGSGYAQPQNFSSIPGNGMGGYPSPAPAPAPTIPGNGMHGVGAAPVYGLPVRPVGPQHVSPFAGGHMPIAHPVGPQQYGGMQGQPNFSNLLMLRRMGLQ